MSPCEPHTEGDVGPCSMGSSSVASRHVILVELFGGMMVGARCLRALGASVVASFHSEIDEDALHIIGEHFPDSVSLGPAP